MGNGCSGRQLAQAAVILLWTGFGLQAQTVPARMRGVQGQPAITTPAVPSPVAPAPVSQPTSLLQQPARQAQVTLSGASLSIRADNSSLSSILHDIANISGMKIEGLGGDERVFGSFGPGAPRDVIADLLDGTAYNLVLLGDLSNGAPRELILTPATHGGSAAASTQVAQGNAEESEPEAEVAPPQPEPPPEQANTPPTPGVKTPQQLFEQLQRMRQNQGQNQGPQPESQQLQPPQQ